MRRPNSRSRYQSNALDGPYRFKRRPTPCCILSLFYLLLLLSLVALLTQVYRVQGRSDESASRDAGKGFYAARIGQSLGTLKGNKP